MKFNITSFAIALTLTNAVKLQEVGDFGYYDLNNDGVVNNADILDAYEFNYDHFRDGVWKLWIDYDENQDAILTQEDYDKAKAKLG